MRLPDFELERFFAEWEFRVRHLLCASDVEPYRLGALLHLMDGEVRELWDSLSLGYTESAGHPLLRSEIAALYDGVGAGDVLVFAGAQEAIFAFANVALGPGDHVIVTWPAYQSLYDVARGCGADVELLELRAGTGWSLDPAAVRARLRPDTRALIVNFPHNPTGALPDPAAWTELVSIADDAGVLLFSDEVYRGLEHDADPLPAAADVCRHGISLGVMSKAYALAGLRIGWIATRDAALLERLAAFRDYTTICSSAPAEVLAIAALRAQDRVLARSRRIVHTNLALLDGFFERNAGLFDWVRPRAGSTAFPRLLADRPIDAFCSDLVHETGVLLLPGTRFGHAGNHFRIGYGRTDMPAALEQLEDYCRRVMPVA
jgi:aspartate/methionine/tyrosine aminotransferase